MEIANLSNLAPCSDYLVRTWEGANPLTGATALDHSAIVKDHIRTQSVWKLVSSALDELGESTPR